MIENHFRKAAKDEGGESTALMAKYRAKRDENDLSMAL